MILYQGIHSNTVFRSIEMEGFEDWPDVIVYDRILIELSSFCIESMFHFHQFLLKEFSFLDFDVIDK